MRTLRRAVKACVMKDMDANYIWIVRKACVAGNLCTVVALSAQPRLACAEAHGKLSRRITRSQSITAVKKYDTTLLRSVGVGTGP